MELQREAGPRPWRSRGGLCGITWSPARVHPLRALRPVLPAGPPWLHPGSPRLRPRGPARALSPQSCCLGRGCEPMARRALAAAAPPVSAPSLRALRRRARALCASLGNVVPRRARPPPQARPPTGAWGAAGDGDVTAGNPNLTLRPQDRLTHPCLPCPLRPPLNTPTQCIGAHSPSPCPDLAFDTPATHTH